MKLNQLSVFLENKPGQLKMACRLLADAQISILTLSLADTKQFGILRLIVREWERALAIMEKAGFVIKVTEVAAVEVADRPGGLAQILQAIEDAGLNVEYMYAFTFGRDGKAVLIFRFDNVDAAILKLREKGVNFVGSVELYARVEN
ncbi:MAG: ACT domain-containing protein [Candidatus Firestonebacteria bacterium]|nr:ACT domain-containing protein [Candidatus Firestonebacteria bacterium]